MSKQIKVKGIFDFFNSIFNTKESWDNFSEADKKAFSKYMVIRWISMNEDYTELMNYLQQYTTEYIPEEQVYKLLVDLTPKGKFFTKYIKAKKDNDKLFNDNLINFIAEKEKWSKFETENNLITLSAAGNYKDILIEYLKMYAISEKEIKSKYKIK